MIMNRPNEMAASVHHLRWFFVDEARGDPGARLVETNSGNVAAVAEVAGARTSRRSSTRTSSADAAHGFATYRACRALIEDPEWFWAAA
jgi:hypothetical protein